MILIFSRNWLRLSRIPKYIAMPVRTSTRQAAVKANKAFTHGPAAVKRKGPAPKGPEPKKGKKEEKAKESSAYEQPSVTEEAQEIRPSEAWSDEQATVNKQPTEAPPTRAEEHVSDGDVKQEEETKQPSIGKKCSSSYHSKREANCLLGQEKKESQPKEKEPKEEPMAEKPETAIRESVERESIIPSTILEKGIIYFFYRPRVNVEHPHGMNEVARSFFVLRPTPKSAQLENGFLGDEENCRLMMLPKKKYPTSGRERDMGFVEKVKVSLKDLHEKFIEGSSYETKTRGERTIPEARPYAEGVYAIIKEGRSSHLAYMLTLPEKLGDIQTDFGLYGRGSFVIQSKNPSFPGPATARLPKDPEYPEAYVTYILFPFHPQTLTCLFNDRVMAKFRDLRWVPTEPEFLDYPNAQFLMIGVAQDNLGKAGDALPAAEKETKERPADELGKLENENQERVDAIAGKCPNKVLSSFGGCVY